MSESERQTVKFRIKFANTFDVTADEAIGEATDADIKKASLLMSRWTDDDLTLLVEFDTKDGACTPVLPEKAKPIVEDRVSRIKKSWKGLGK